MIALTNSGSLYKEVWVLILVMSVFISFDGYSQTSDHKAPSGVQIVDRKPQFPLKTKSMIYSDEEIRFARDKIRKNEKAARYAKTIVESGEKWLAWKDAELMNLIPDATVPRSFDVGVKGCPVHGEAIFKTGRYSWILDPKEPFTIECPVGHEIYPSNDFRSYYESGYQMHLDTTIKYTDDGWGWKGPDGEKYWFVAYANQWMLLNVVRPAIRDLGRAYLITGRSEFAHKALVFLYRLAEVYPAMDYEHQSRYGQMQKLIGKRYPGKVVNLIWECFFIQDVAESYDAVWENIDRDTALQRFLAKSSYEIQAFIEANLLEEAVESYTEGKIKGNFGMHQMALIYILLARQNMNNEKFIYDIIHNVSEDYRETGIKYALYDFVFRDGIPMESPSYNTLWIRSLSGLGNRLKSFGEDIFKMDRMKSILKSPMALCIDHRYSIDVGDSGSILGGVQGRERNTYEIAYLNYKDSIFLDWIAPLYELNRSEQKSVMDLDDNFETLFRPDFELLTASKKLKSENSSRLLPGYGLGILDVDKHMNAVAMTYGMHGSHFHWDFLNIELFANGQKMIPDFGYPDAMNAYVPEIFTWSKNTSSHNTVVVNAQKQDQNLPGAVHDFSIGEFAKTMDASSPAYSFMETYRRHIIQVSAGVNQSYIVDFFRLKGGQVYDYILHGPPGEVRYDADQWSEVLPGTYAGKTVSLGEIYDDTTLNKPNYTGSYAGYAGSGFQHLFNVQKKINGEVKLKFQHIRDENAEITIHVLPRENQEVFMADAYDLPKAKNYIVKHIICHSGQQDKNLKNTFISVLEPHYMDEFIITSDRISFDKRGQWSQAVRVKRENATDIIISDSENSEKTIDQYSISTDAQTAVLTFDTDTVLERIFFSDGTFLTSGGQTFEAHELSGFISEIDFSNKSFTIQMDQNILQSGMKYLNKGVVFILRNNQHRTEYTVSSLEIKEDQIVVAANEDLLTGYLNVSRSTDSDTFLECNSALVFEETYVGAYILNEKFDFVGEVISIEDGKIKFYGDIDKIFKLDNTANIWIGNVGIGDRATFKTQLEWCRPE